MSDSSIKIARQRAYENYKLVIAENLVTKGSKTRFSKGNIPKSKYFSEQTRLKMQAYNTKNK